MAKIIAEVECDLGSSVKFSVPPQRSIEEEAPLLGTASYTSVTNVSFSDSELWNSKLKVSRGMPGLHTPL